MSNFEIFIIGPMGSDKDSPEETATPISYHITNIKSALEDIAPSIAPKGVRIDVYAPTDGMSDVEAYVFNRIDAADLAIADITARSPSVMYELAYFHALGTPMIILDHEGKEAQKTPFYLKGANILRVPDFDTETLKRSLSLRLSAFFEPNDDQDFAENPISKFYSAPLVEAAGAAAVARGYYWNLINAVVNAGNGVIATHEKQRLLKLKIIKPSENFAINEDLARFGKLAAQWNNGRRLHEYEWNITQSGRSRGVKAYKIGHNIYDYPRTIGSLERSPRLNRVSGKRAPGDRVPVSEERLAAARNRVSIQLVRFFLGVLEDEIHKNRREIFEDRVEFISLDDFEDELKGVPKPQTIFGVVRRFLRGAP